MFMAGDPPEVAASYDADFRNVLLLDDELRMATKPVFFHRSGPFALNSAPNQPEPQHGNTSTDFFHGLLQPESWH
jgi:hypothetical protein